MPRESLTDRKKRTARIIFRLRRAYPRAACSLNYRTPMDLLVATILSAQCTDQRVNIITKELFSQYTCPADYAAVSQEVLEAQIRSAGFYRNKAKSIRGAAARIVADFDGQVPRTMDELLSLRGVARKTANVVLGNAFGINAGIATDTHVSRVSRRVGLTRHENNQSDRIEKDLTSLVPQAKWSLFSHLLIFHGRSICTARKPRCDECPISDLCAYLSAPACRPSGHGSLRRDESPP